MKAIPDFKNHEGYYFGSSWAMYRNFEAEVENKHGLEFVMEIRIGKHRELFNEFFASAMIRCDEYGIYRKTIGSRWANNPKAIDIVYLSNEEQEFYYEAKLIALKKILEHLNQQEKEEKETEEEIQECGLEY